MLKLISFFLISTLFLKNAFASLMIEPYIGYESETISSKLVNNTEASGKGTAINLGGRFGWSFMGLWTALDVNMSTGGKFNPNTTSAGTDYTTKRQDMGLAIGYDFPIKLRAYMTYNLSSEQTLTSTTAGVSSDIKYSGGTSYKIGVGFGIIAWLTANLEYFSNSPKTVAAAGSSVDMSTVYTSFSDTGTRLMLSFPLHL